MTTWSERLHLSRDRVTVVPPGIDPRFSPGGTLDPDPFVVAVGRLVPVKRFAWFVEAMVALKERQPRLRAMIVGEGYERPELEARIADAGAGEWFSLPGRVTTPSWSSCTDGPGWWARHRCARGGA